MLSFGFNNFASTNWEMSRSIYFAAKAVEQQDHLKF